MNRFIEEKDSGNHYLIDVANIYMKNNEIKFYLKPVGKRFAIGKTLYIKFNKANPLEIAIMDTERHTKKIERGRFRFDKNDLDELVKELKGKKIIELNKETKKSFETREISFYYRITLKDKAGKDYSLKFKFDKPFESVIELYHGLGDDLELKVKTEIKKHNI